MKNNHSNMIAAGHLLECMQCRLNPKVWYTQFLTALETNGQRDLADLIEPDFCSDPELWTRKVDEKLDIDSLLFNGNIQTSDEPNGDILAINEELKELAAHEESVLKSAASVRLELESNVQERRKSEQRLLTEVQSHQNVIVDQIQNKRTALLNRYKQNTNQVRQVDLHAEREQMEGSKLKTNDNKLATLIMKKTRSLSSVFGTIYSNVVFDKGKDSLVSPTAHPGINTRDWDVDDDGFDQEPQVKDENETSSESSVPSSGYLIVQGMEKLEVENPSENVVSALIHNRSIQIAEHQRGCVFSDIKVLSNGEIAVCDSTHACIMVLDRYFCFKEQLKLDGQHLHIGTIFNNRLAVHLDNTSNIVLFHAQSKDKRILQWVCQSDMCTLCTNGGTNIYTLCEGKHMHVFKLDVQKCICDDYSFSAIQKNNWWPRFMAVDEHSFAEDDPAAIIYLTERNTNSSFCFYLRHKRLTIQWKYEGAGFLSLSGIVCCFDRIIVADSNNYILLELDKKGNYKTDHEDEGILRPYALAVSEKEIFVTRANTGRDDLNKTIQCYTIQFSPQTI